MGFGAYGRGIAVYGSMHSHFWVQCKGFGMKDSGHYMSEKLHSGAPSGFKHQKTRTYILNRSPQCRRNPGDKGQRKSRCSSCFNHFFLCPGKADSCRRVWGFKSSIQGWLAPPALNWLTRNAAWRDTATETGASRQDSSLTNAHRPEPQTIQLAQLWGSGVGSLQVQHCTWLARKPAMNEFPVAVSDTNLTLHPTSHPSRKATACCQAVPWPSSVAA